MTLFTKILFVATMAYTCQAGFLPGGPHGSGQSYEELQLGGESYRAALISSHNEPGPYQAAGQPESFQGLIRAEQSVASGSSGSYSNGLTSIGGFVGTESAAVNSNGGFITRPEPSFIVPHNVFTGQGLAFSGSGSSFGVANPTNVQIFQASAPIVRTIDRPVPFEVVREIQVPVPQAVPVPVPQAVHVPVPRPYPVHFTVESKVPYPVVRTQAVEVPRAVPYDVEKHVQVVVDRHVRVPVNRPVEVVRQVPVPVSNPVSVANVQYAQGYRR